MLVLGAGRVAGIGGRLCVVVVYPKGKRWSGWFRREGGAAGAGALPWCSGRGGVVAEVRRGRRASGA